MGDKPEPIPFVNACPTPFWPDGLVPPYLDLVFSGFVEGIDYARYPTWLPNGSFRCAFDSCINYSVTMYPWIFSIQIFANQLTAVANLDPVSIQFAQTVELSEYCSGDEPATPSHEIVTGGSFGVVTHLDGIMLPASWDAAGLVGVPEKPGYFAEELETVIASRKMRYANHSNGTNVKVYME